MDWQKGRQSDNVVEDEGGGGGGGFGGGGARFGGFHLGIGGIIVVVVIGLMFPSLRPILFGLFLGGDTGSEVQQSTPAPTRETSASTDPQVKFVRSLVQTVLENQRYLEASQLPFEIHWHFAPHAIILFLDFDFFLFSSVSDVS